MIEFILSCGRRSRNLRRGIGQWCKDSGNRNIFCIFVHGSATPLRSARRGSYRLQDISAPV